MTRLTDSTEMKKIFNILLLLLFITLITESITYIGIVLLALYAYFVFFLFKNTNNIGKGAVFVINLIALSILQQPFESKMGYIIFGGMAILLFSTIDNNNSFLKPKVVRELRKYKLQKIKIMYLIFIFMYYSFVMFSAMINEYDSYDNSPSINSITTDKKNNVTKSDKTRMEKKQKQEQKKDESKGKTSEKNNVYVMLLTLLFSLFSVSFIIGLPGKKLYEYLIYIFDLTGTIAISFLIIMYDLATIPLSVLLFLFFIRRNIVKRYKNTKEKIKYNTLTAKLDFSKSVKKSILFIIFAYMCLNAVFLNIYVHSYNELFFYYHQSWFILYPLSLLLILSILSLLMFKLKRNYRIYLLLPVSVLDFILFVLSIFAMSLLFEKQMIMLNRALSHDLETFGIE